MSGTLPQGPALDDHRKLVVSNGTMNHCMALVPVTASMVTLATTTAMPDIAHASANHF
jgi:hypothetical protein